MFTSGNDIDDFLGDGTMMSAMMNALITSHTLCIYPM
jgi:hypothetical protein